MLIAAGALKPKAALYLRGIITRDTNALNGVRTEQFVMKLFISRNYRDPSKYPHRHLGIWSGMHTDIDTQMLSTKIKSIKGKSCAPSIVQCSENVLRLSFFNQAD